MLTLLHSERPKFYAILTFLSAIGLKGLPESLPCFSAGLTKLSNFDDSLFTSMDNNAISVRTSCRRQFFHSYVDRL